MSEALRHARFRFHGELNDFLPEIRRGQFFEHGFPGAPAIKDPIQALGVPHTEIGCILVDGEAVGFEHRLRGGEMVEVFPAQPVPAALSAPACRPLRPVPEPRFVLDVHLGRLAAYLRLLGFDCLYRNDFGDAEIARIALREHRIVLTRDIGLLKHNAVVHGAFLRATRPILQLREVLDRFRLGEVLEPFSRCSLCNGRVDLVEKSTIRGEVPEKVYAYCQDFSRCRECRRIFWPGGQYERMKRQFADIGIALP